MSSVRAFPMPRHENRGPGWCSWCGLEILHDSGAKQGQRNTRRTWHPSCVQDYKLHTWPAVQTAHLRERDGAVCRECGETPSKWLFNPYRVIRPWSGSQDAVRVGPYIGIERVEALELEHVIPLWSTTQLPPEERRRYFGPSNLQLLCRTCHAAKTAREAAARGKAKRLAGETGQGVKRPIPSRGFDQTKTRGLDGKVRERT